MKTSGLARIGLGVLIKFLKQKYNLAGRIALIQKPPCCLNLLHQIRRVGGCMVKFHSGTHSGKIPPGPNCCHYEPVFFGFGSKRSLVRIQSPRPPKSREITSFSLVKPIKIKILFLVLNWAFWSFLRVSIRGKFGEGFPL